MLEARRIETNIQPNKFESLGDNTFYYNYDIKSEVIMVRSMEDEEEVHEETRWNFVQVHINGKPTYEKCVTAIIRQFIDQDREISLVNEYASKNLDIEETGSEEYIEYLSLISNIKYKVKLDFGLTEEKDPLEEAKKKVLRKIDEYDTSDAVNSFILSGVDVWLDKSTRVGLQNSISIEKEAGRSETTLWFNGNKIIVGCTLALQMLSILELYALNCYNKTAEHRNNVQKLTTVEEVLSYDYTIGYPEKPEFNI